MTAHRWAPANPSARDETTSAEGQLSRICFYYPPKEAARILASVDWATDEQKLAAVETQQRMTGGAELLWR